MTALTNAGTVTEGGMRSRDDVEGPRVLAETFNGVRPRRSATQLVVGDLLRQQAATCTH